ncbi:MAG: cupin domain-containing protein [Planctomycetota bacterium]|nr:cupin domain-containing protein [Planctomycetota bacterium]
MQTVNTFTDFKKVVGQPVAHLVNGEVFPFSFAPPDLFDLVDQARHHPKVKVCTGQRGNDLKTSLKDADPEGFKQLPIEQAARSPVHLTIYELGSLREKGGALAEAAGKVYWPLVELWKGMGLRWKKVYPILFLSGPGCSTNYHWDPSSVLIVQLYGRKRFHSLREPKKWCPELVADKGHEAMFKPKALSDDDIISCDLNPGEAVWSPCRAPHWVDAYDETAFTMSIAFTAITADEHADLEMTVM